MNLNDLLSRYAGLTADDLRGTALAGSLPLTDAVVNTLIARRLASTQWPVTKVTVAAQGGDSLAAEVQPRAPFVPSVKVLLAIERQPIFPDDPVLHLRWSLAGMGALSSFAAPMLATFGTRFPGVSVNGDRVAINVVDVLRARGLDDVAAALRELELRTERGIAVVRFSVGL